MMIYVDITYKRKKDHQYHDGTKEFDDVNKALRFMYYCAYHEILVTSYRCDNVEDKEYLDKKFNFNLSYKRIDT